MNASREVAALLLLSAFLAAHAAEFRDIRPILAPGGVEGAATGPVEKPVDRATAEAAARTVMASWNTPEMEAALAESFVDRERLLDAMSERVPFDAELQVLGVQGVQTLGQQVEGGRRVSTVTVTVRAELRFEDPAAGLVRREGTSELLLRISQPVP